MTPVIVDTSVWRAFFAGKARAHSLGEMLDEDGAVLTHACVVGELVLGGLGKREEVLLERLPSAPEVTSAELLAFMRARRLGRRGIGWVDCQLLASALVASASLWSLDKALAAAAEELGVDAPPLR